MMLKYYYYYYSNFHLHDHFSQVNKYLYLMQTILSIDISKKPFITNGQRSKTIAKKKRRKKTSAK